MQTAVDTRKTAPAHFRWRSASVISKGNVRRHNEDSLLELPKAGLWAVADGMGGHNAGDVASRMIVESLAAVRRHAKPSDLLNEVEDRLGEVNSELFQVSLGGSGVSGSTVAVLLALDRHVLCVWAGDSRIYRWRSGEFAQLTRDHSETQEMIDGGLITAEKAAEREASNVITRAVGGAEDLHLDVELYELRNDDRFLICSDGLYRELPDSVLAQHLAKKNPSKACAALLEHALAGECRDNISAIIVQFAAA
jgi:serine/threonine protein phosphatase PrpC